MTPRDKEIVGKPTRIEPVAEVPADMKDVVSPPPGYKDKPGEVPVSFGMMLHNPGLLRKYRPVLSHFRLEGLLPVRDRELAVLRLGWLVQIPYVWGEHVAIGKQNGITPEEIERVTVGSGAEGWSTHDRAVVRAVEELHGKGMISDETWATLARTWNEAQLVEFPMLIGHYQMLGYFQNSLRLPLTSGNVGLAAR
jgi:hypothetical protein